MPYTGGLFALLSSYKATTRTPIPSASHNAVLEDLQTAQNFPRPVGAGGTGSNTADGAAKALALISNKILAGVSAVAGSADEITIDTAQNFDALTNLVVVAFRPTATSVSGGTTVALDGLDAKAVRKIAASGDVDISTRDMIAGGIYTLVYDPTADGGDGAFILVNPSSIADEAVGTGRYDLRNMGPSYLRRDGGVYLKVDYPDLALLLPSLPDGVIWSNTNAISTGTVRKVVETATGYLMMVDDGSSSTKVYTASATADDWALVATITGFRVFDFVLNGTTYVAIDGTGKVSRSADGVTWTSPTAVLTFAGISGIAFAFGLYVIVGDAGKIATSPDGVTWTPRTSGSTQFLYKIKLVNGVLVIVGGNGTILSSTDGINWTPRTSGVTVILFDVAFGAGLYVIVGAGGTILTSSNLVSWTLRTSGTTVQLTGIAYSTSGFMTGGDTGTIRISTAGTSWASANPVTTVNFFSINFDPDNQARYFAGGNGALFIGLRTLPTQFQVPDAGDPNEWIRALP